MFAMLTLEKETSIVGNRTRIEILASILNVAHNGALKTHIMYRSNLSHRQLEKYLGFLITNGLLERITDPEYRSNLYRVTEKGIEFLNDYSRLSAHLNGKIF